VYSILGHAFGKHAPGRSSDRSRSPEGDSLREPYIVGHNLLLAHASAVQAFRQRFAGKKHQIGLVVNMNWGGGSPGRIPLMTEPYDQSPESKSGITIVTLTPRPRGDGAILCSDDQMARVDSVSSALTAGLPIRSSLATTQSR
jgi:hypothetical protein